MGFKTLQTNENFNMYITVKTKHSIHIHDSANFYFVLLLSPKDPRLEKIDMILVFRVHKTFKHEKKKQHNKVFG